MHRKTDKHDNMPNRPFCSMKRKSREKLVQNCGQTATLGKYLFSKRLTSTLMSVKYKFQYSGIF